MKQSAEFQSGNYFTIIVPSTQLIFLDRYRL